MMGEGGLLYKICNIIKMESNYYDIMTLSGNRMEGPHIQI